MSVTATVNTLTLPQAPDNGNERLLAGYTVERQTGAVGGTLTLSATPVDGLTLVWKNGTLLDPSGGASVSGTTVTLGVAAIAGDVFVITYYART